MNVIGIFQINKLNVVIWNLEKGTPEQKEKFTCRVEILILIC